MLVIGRLVNERTVIIVPPSTEPTIICETYVGRRGQHARLGYDAPRNVQIDREEVHRDKQRRQRKQVAP